jgi:hypothetical protein
MGNYESGNGRKNKRVIESGGFKMNNMNHFLLEEIEKYKKYNHEVLQLGAYGDGIYHDTKTINKTSNYVEHITQCGKGFKFKDENHKMDWFHIDENVIVSLPKKALPYSEKICTDCLQKIYEEKIDSFEHQFDMEHNSYMPAELTIAFDSNIKPFVKKFMQHEGIDGLSTFVSQLIKNYIIDHKIDMDKFKEKSH